MTNDINLIGIFLSVLTPFSAEAKVILNNVEDYKMPKIYIMLSVDDAEARMSHSQVAEREREKRERERES